MTLQQNTLSFIQTAKKPKEKNDFLLKKGGVGGGGMLYCSHQAERQAVVEEARNRAPLWKALINPDLSGALTRGGEARQERGLENGGAGRQLASYNATSD